jgi:hypothetical protein
MNNANEVRHIATLVLLEMAARCDANAAALAVVAGDPPRPGSIYPYRSTNPETQARLNLWRRIKWSRSCAKEYRAIAEQPEREEFERRRKIVTQMAQDKGIPLAIGEPNPPIHEAVAAIGRLYAVLDDMPDKPGLKTPGPETDDISDAPPANAVPTGPCVDPPNPTNNCDCHDCGSKEGA